MITVKPDSPYFNTADEKLEEIISTHIAYMQSFCEYDDIKYSILVPETESEAARIDTLNIDHINITGDYYEATVIDDDSVTVAVIHKNLISKGILALVDEFS